MMATIADLPHEILDIIFGDQHSILLLIFKRISRHWCNQMRGRPLLGAAEGLTLLIEQKEIHLLSALFSASESEIKSMINISFWENSLHKNSKPTKYLLIRAFTRNAVCLGNLNVIKWVVEFCDQEFDFDIIDAIHSGWPEIVRIVLTQRVHGVRAAPAELARHPLHKNYEGIMHELINFLTDFDGKFKKPLKGITNLVINSEYEALRRLPANIFLGLDPSVITIIRDAAPDDINWLMTKIALYDVDGFFALTIAITEERLDIIPYICEVHNIPIDDYADSFIKITRLPKYESQGRWLRDRFDSIYIKSQYDEYSDLYYIRKDLKKIHRIIRSV